MNNKKNKCIKSIVSPDCGQSTVHDLNVFLPVDILWIRGVADSPFLCVELGAELRALGLPTAVTALTLASIKIFQDSEKKHPPKQRNRQK